MVSVRRCRGRGKNGVYNAVRRCYVQTLYAASRCYGSILYTASRSKTCVFLCRLPPLFIELFPCPLWLEWNPCRVCATPESLNCAIVIAFESV
jgi:hypothetical protein